MQSQENMYIFIWYYSKNYKVKPLIACSTTHMVHLIQRPCGLQYVGWTTRAFRVRLNEHIANIHKGSQMHKVSQHYDRVYNRDLSGTLFMGIDLLFHFGGGVLKSENCQG